MKIKTLTTCFLFALALSSCIRDEALNSEAAIDACVGSDVQMANINADSKVVNVYVHKGADLAKQQLTFTIPFGASLKPSESKAGDTATTYDFSASDHSRNFTVTSEDGNWTATYKVNVVLTEMPLTYHFEDLLESNNTPYEIFYEFDQGSSQEISKLVQWSSGNPGFKLTGMANNKSDYPTVQAAAGKVGKCVKLETRDTGSFGAMVKMYIAAGNLFIGSFEVTDALTDPRKATRFGFQFYKKPTTLKGYYKYKAGDVFTAEGKPQSGIKDKCDIYAVMYEASDNSFMLNGDDVFTSSKVVSLARMAKEDVVESNEWTEFNLPFEAKNGLTIDPQKLNAGKYKLAIVLSSSLDGANFKGAVGSTLYVDEIEIVCED